MSTPRSGVVLVVDEDQRVRSSVADLIRAYMPTLIVVPSGTVGANQHVLAELPSLALVDVRVAQPAPGLDLIGELQAAGVVVIAMSAAPTLERDAVQAGATSFINKTHSLEELMEILRSTFGPGPESDAV